tara:strand:+ start:8559 stop:8951 length:393 start_codon:yes stop_codon:yes gene_type:complete
MKVTVPKVTFGNVFEFRSRLKSMNKSIDTKLKRYSKTAFDKSLNHLENDVKNRLMATKADSFEPIGFMEKLFGMPFSLSGSALASTLILGIFIGTQFQPVKSLAHSNISDLGVFSPTNAALPSSLLDPKK